MVQTVTVTMKQDYGLYENQRGINTINLPYKTPNYERGGPYYPNTLEETKGSGIELPFSDYCQDLSNAGCNILRVKWFGGNSSADNGWCAIEPPPYGTYNIWQTALDPDNLATYRSQQVTYPVGAAAWSASNLKEFTDQCAAYNINLLVILFETSEFAGYPWNFHAWNANNRYINGTLCEVADRGFLTNAYEFYTDATAIAAAKARIDFVVDVLGTNKAVVAWELFAEMSWLLTPGFWGESYFNAAMINNVRTKVSPWVTTMGNYLRAKDPYNRPIAIGLLRPYDDGSAWPADPDHVRNVQAEPMLQYPIDICCMNMYNDNWYQNSRMLKRAHEKTDKLLWVTQYSPIFFDPNPREEVSPFSESIKHQWLGVCGERWGLVPQRWPGLYDSGSGWQTGGYADSDFYSIPGVMSTFCGNVSWNTWKTYNYPFDQYVTSTGTSALNSYGDGENVTMVVEWSSGGTKTLDVSNLSNGTYTFTYYNWSDGTVAGTLAPVAAGGSLSMSLSVTSYADNCLVAHLLKN